MVELGFLDQIDLCTLDRSESETENNETEKEDKDQKEKELFMLLHWSAVVRSSSKHLLLLENRRYESMTFDIPSPPPDHLS